MSLSFSTAGDPSKPAILFQHGFLSSNLQWAPNWPELSEHFHLVGVELLGHGESAAPTEQADYECTAYMEAYERIRRELGIAQWVACGQSFGAGLMIRYAEAHPEAVTGLVITNSRSALSAALADSRLSRPLEEWEQLDVRSLPFHPVHGKRLAPELRDRMVEAADAVPARALWGATQVTGPSLFCRDVLAALDLPRLLINGKWEKSFQPDRDYVVSNFPDVSVVDLDGGHSVNMDAPDAFNASLTEFVLRQNAL